MRTELKLVGVFTRIALFALLIAEASAHAINTTGSD
jgi:hypothetical protein